MSIAATVVMMGAARRRREEERRHKEHCKGMCQKCKDEEMEWKVWNDFATRAKVIKKLEEVIGDYKPSFWARLFAHSSDPRYREWFLLDLLKEIHRDELNRRDHQL